MVPGTVALKQQHGVCGSVRGSLLLCATVARGASTRWRTGTGSDEWMIIHPAIWSSRLISRQLTVCKYYSEMITYSRTYSTIRYLYLPYGTGSSTTYRYTMVRNLEYSCSCTGTGTGRTVYTVEGKQSSNTVVSLSRQLDREKTMNFYY